MTQSFRVVALIALIVVAAVGGSFLLTPTRAQDRDGQKGAAAPKWEYRVVVVTDSAVKDGEKELNELGEQGFELVFVTSAPLSKANDRNTVSEARPFAFYTLRRAKR